LGRSAWLEQFLEKVACSSAEGGQAVEYIRAHGINIRIKRARKGVGAFWTLNHGLYLNSLHYTRESALENPRAWTLVIHEVRHLQQGPLTALSVYGELDAWQHEFQVYKRITGRQLHATLEELLAIPLDFNREHLRYARNLMMRFAGKGYGANFLPLYPINREIKYWLNGGQN
jgi:hypothetical protein